MNQREAVWSTYIVSSEPDVRTFQLLEDQYRFGIDTINEPWALHYRPGADSPANSLADRLMGLYKIGMVIDELLDHFYAHAPATVRARAMRMAAFQLPPSLPLEMAERLKRLWERRLDAVESMPADQQAHYMSEIAEFRGWFNSGAFEPDWALAQLKRVLQISRTIGPNTTHSPLLRVAATLAAFAHTHLRETTECLELLVELVPPERGIVSLMDDEREIIELALQSGDQKRRITRYGPPNC